MGRNFTLAAPSSQADESPGALGLGALLDWGDASALAPQPTFTSAPDVIAAHAVRIAGLAADSPTAATRERSALVGAAWVGHAHRCGWDLAERPAALALGVDAGPDAADRLIRRWSVVSAGEVPAAVLLIGPSGASGLIWRESLALASSPRHALVGLEGLELIDLTGPRDPPAVTLAGDDIPAAARALADILDGAVDLGLALGFVRRVADYLADRFLADGEAVAQLDPTILEQLGGAYAALAVASEGLREATHAAAGDPGEWATVAADHRRDIAPQLGALLSDLFEAAGASATAGRYGLDRPWRDFTTRQAVFPPGSDPRGEDDR